MGATAKAHLLAEPPTPEGNSVAGVDQIRVWLRESIEEACEKYEVVALAIGVKEPYLSQMLSLDPRNQKPIQWRHITALPDAVECIFARKYAESFGQIVVSPVSEAEGRRQFITGLVSLLNPKRVRMAKAGLR